MRMPSSRHSSRNDLVDRLLSRNSVSLCCTSGCPTMVTPSMVRPLEHDPEKLQTFRTRSCSKSKTPERYLIQPEWMALSSKYGPVADDGDRRRAVRPQPSRQHAACGPGPALQDARERKVARIAPQPRPNQRRQAVEQGHGEGAPFDHQRRGDIMPAGAIRGVAEHQRAGIDEQPAIAILCETGQ